jgi:hypothetical protein
MFSSCFFLIYFCQELFSVLEAPWPLSNDKEKTPPEDDHQDPQLKEEVESEAEEK